MVFPKIRNMDFVSRFFGVLLFFLCIFCVPGLEAREADSSGYVKDAFSLDLTADAFLLTSGVSLSAAGFFLQPDSHDWDGVKYDSSGVNAFDRPFIHSYNRAFDFTGDVLVGLSLVAPASMVFFIPEKWLTLSVMYAETLLIANGIKEIMKNGISRTRPYMYADNPPEKDIKDGDFDRSFPSGHTTMAFSSAVFFSYVFSKYFPDSVYRYPVYAGSFLLAATTAGMRIASANHFPTDVLAGAAIGSLVGFFVPFVHTLNENLQESRGNDGISFALSPAGAAVSFNY